nr:GPP34 family phosphoprotein [Pseudoclavibacter terrae]
MDADAKPGTFVAVGQPLDPVAAGADLEALVEIAVGRKPDAAVKLKEGIAEEFVDAGVLGHEEKKFLGGTFSERWPRGGNAQLEDSVQAEARALLTGDAEPREADRVAAALALLHAVRVLPRVFPDLDRASISKRAEEVVDLAAVAGELGKMIREAQLSVILTLSTLAITTRD